MNSTGDSSIHLQPPDGEQLRNVRAFAVAKLKRAASLPRMKDGRRPPMHGEAVSEGERATPSPNSTIDGEQDQEQEAFVVAAESGNTHQGGDDDGDDEEADTPHAHEHEFGTSSLAARPPEPDEVVPMPPEEEDPYQEQDSQSAQSRTTTPTTTTAQRRKKRRSRSRSRSRSKDFKEMISSGGGSDTPDDQNFTPTQQDQLPPPIPISPFIAAVSSPRLPAFLTPTSARTAATLQSPPFIPQTPTSPSPLPSLDAIRAGLIRSNSAAGRMMAFHKLTGGTESPEPMRLSPSPSPSPFLTRSNTVTGGERMAARSLMMRRLGERRMKEADGSEPAITEESPVNTPTSTPTRRRPIPPDLVASPSLSPSPSRHPQQLKRSPPASGVVDDREVSETSPNSPVMRAMAESATSTPMPDTFGSGPRYSSSSSGFALSGLDDLTTSTSGMSHGPFEYDTAEVRDGVVIEPDEPVDNGATSSSLPRLFTNNYPVSGSSSPFGQPVPRIRTRPSETTMASASSSTLTAEPIPLFMPTQGEQSPYKQDTFPVAISPFGTPNKESIIAESEEEGETVVYPEDIKARKAWLDRLEGDSRMSLGWKSPPSSVAASGSTYPWKNHMPSTDEEDGDEEDDDDVPLAKVHARSPPSAFNSRLLDARGVASPHFRNVDVEMTPSPETSTSATSPSGLHGLLPVARTPSTRTSRASESASQGSSSMRAPYAAAQNKSQEAQETLTDWEDVHTDKDIPTPPEVVREKAAKTKESPWQKVRAFARSGSSMGMANVGRRSRSNSFINGKREESSRESAASANSATNLASPMNPTASSSMLSLSPGAAPPPRGGVSPVPPASAADLARYADHQKLMPFPGLAKLQEEKKQRDRSESVMANHASHPVEPAEGGLERRPSNSKKGSPSRPGNGGDDKPGLTRSGSQRVGTPASDRPMSPARVLGSSTSTLPTSREGVRKWLNLNTKKWLPGGQDTPGPPGVEIVPPGTAMKPPERRPSESEAVTLGNRTSDSPTEKKDLEASTSSKPPAKDMSQAPTVELSADPFTAPAVRADSMTQDDARSASASESPPLATPSSANTFPRLSPGHSMGEPSPNPSHMQSFGASQQLARESASRLEERRMANITAKLDTILEHAARDPNRKSALESPPRKLLLVSKAFQVLDRNTIKDRYLFLFTDILVIAKPMEDGAGKDPLDHTFAVKSIVELTKLDFDPYREGDGSTSGSDFNKHPSVRVFVQGFVKDPEVALAAFLEKTKLKDDPMTVANLLFRTTDLDKTQLGQYLSRRNNKNVLKAFVDRFGFAGVRIDNSLRAFLLSLRLPRDATLLENLLVTFAYRWFEANKGSVAYDKEVAARLVFAMMQLNDALHSDLDSDMTPAGGVFSFPNRSVEARDFVEAFRVLDRQMLVLDEMLVKIFGSIQTEKLAQALDSSVTPIVASITSDVSTRLTTRIPSEPITIRIPKPDPQFGIHLQGQDLLFEPPFLSFAHSAEMSFRVIGNPLGSKTAILARTGANANLYTGIPFSKPFYVERPFMRHTFRVAFLNHLGLSRKYLFSVESKAEHANWTALLGKQIAKCRAEPPMVPLGPVSVKVRKAAEAVALRVLRDSLIAPDDVGKPDNTGSKARGPLKPVSPSFVQASTLSNDNGQARGSSKTGHELITVCQQNSLIPLVLSFLNAVKPI